MSVNLTFDLLKAIDKTKCVQVQRTVTNKQGTVFTRNQWVRPDQVLKTDKILSNQSVLDKYNKDQDDLLKQQIVAKGKLDRAEFDRLRNVDIGKAVEYAKKCGVKWTEVPNNKNINWMRCAMAVKALDNVKYTVPAGKVLDMSKIPASWNSLGKKDKMAELLKTNSKADIMEYAKSQGVTWKDTKEDGTKVKDYVEWMRASMAIQKWLEGKNLLDLDVTAPVPDSIKKPEPKQEPKPAPEPKVEPDELEIPANATERQKNLITLVNGITNTDDLRTFTKIGIIPEDDTAKSFVVDKLLKSRENWIKAHQPTRGGQNHANYSPSYSLMDSLGVYGCHKKVLDRGFHHMNDSLTSRIFTDPMNFSFIKVGRYEDTDPAYLLKRLDDVFSQNAQDTWVDSASSINQTNSGYQGWDKDLNKASFDLEKSGFVLALRKIEKENPETKSEVDRMVKKYNELMELVDYNTKELSSIYNSNPDFSDYTGTGSYLPNHVEYNEVSFNRHLKKCIQHQKENIPKILKSFGLSDDDIKTTTSSFWNSDMGAFRLFRANGDPIDLSDAKYSNYTSYASGWRSNSIDLTKVIDPSTNKPYLDEDLLCCNSNTLRYIGTPDIDLKTCDDKDLVECIENVNKIYSSAELTPEKFAKVHKTVLELFSLDLFDKSSNKPITDAELDQLETYTNLYNYTPRTNTKVVPKSSTPELNTLISNLRMLDINASMNKEIVNSLDDNVRSKINSNGDDYSQNYQYYTTSRVGLGYGNVYNGKYMPGDISGARGWTQGGALTADEINSKVKSQLDKAPIVNKETIDNIKNYIDTHKDPNVPNSGVISLGSNAVGSFKLSDDCFRDNPMKDIYMQESISILSNVPNMTKGKTSDKFEEFLKKKADYVPYNFGSDKQYTQSELKALKNLKTVQQPKVSLKSELKTLRESLINACHCSIKTCDSTTRAKNESYVKQNWDRGAKDSSGKRLYGYISAKFDNAYEIKNSEQEERYEAMKAQDPTNKPVTMFHGTKYSGAAGICGVDGKFKVPKDEAEARKMGVDFTGGMLGRGVYLANMAGKSSGYISSRGWGNGYGGGGCLMICEAVHGNTKIYPDHYAAKYDMTHDTVGVDAGATAGFRTIRAPEWAVRNPDRVLPKYIMDMEAVHR